MNIYFDNCMLDFQAFLPLKRVSLTYKISNNEKFRPNINPR